MILKYMLDSSLNQLFLFTFSNSQYRFFYSWSGDHGRTFEKTVFRYGLLNVHRKMRIADLHFGNVETNPSEK